MADPDPVPLVSLLVEGDDPRRLQARRHALEAILLLATLAVIGSADKEPKVEFFVLWKQALLETFLDLPHGIPSPDPSGRVFGLLAPAQWETCLAATLPAALVAVDGKAARGSHDQARSVSPLHLVSAGWTTGPTRSRPSRRWRAAS